jgi:N-acetylneuraminic acid mutarotase
LLTGGSDFVSTVFPASDIYDAATGAWTVAAALGQGRISHAAIALRTGDVLVSGGGGSTPLGSAERFDVAAGRWVSAGDMRVPRANHAAVLLPNGKVLVVGGQGVGAATSAEIYDPG